MGRPRQSLQRARRHAGQQRDQRSGELLALVLCRSGVLDARTGAGGFRYAVGAAHAGLVAGREGAPDRRSDLLLGQDAFSGCQRRSADRRVGLRRGHRRPATWLARRIERLEFIAEFLARRDVDGDGLVEATQSGNYGTLKQPARSCAWWDALNCGHKDSYSNALIYRAWRCLADLEAKANRRDQQARYTQLADRLKAAYFKTLFNPQHRLAGVVEKRGWRTARLRFARRQRAGHRIRPGRAGARPRNPRAAAAEDAGGWIHAL